MKSHYEHIVGGSEESRKEARRKFQESFERGSRMPLGEIEKGEEEHDLIRDTEARVDQMVEAWGGKVKDIPTSHIHMVRRGSVERDTGGRISGGSHDMVGSSVDIEMSGSGFWDSHTLAHELFHLKSFKSGQVREDGDVAPYRSGLQMIDRHDQTSKQGFQKMYFGILEEAVVAESAMLFSLENQNEEYKDELDATRSIVELACKYLVSVGAPDEVISEVKQKVICIPYARDLMRNIEEHNPDNEELKYAYATGVLKGVHDRGGIMEWERAEERTAMYALIDRIIEASSGKFKERREVFDIIARANYSGNYLPLARVVEESFGPGSFRKLAETFAERREKESETLWESLGRFWREE